MKGTKTGVTTLNLYIKDPHLEVFAALSRNNLKCHRSIVGSFIHLEINSHPDFEMTASSLSSHYAEPNKNMFQEKLALRYSNRKISCMTILKKIE